MRLLALILFTLLPFSAMAEQVVAALSQNRVSITANFDGSEIIIFGAVKRETSIPEEGQLDVIITVAGPEQVETVRRKDRRYGIWVNVEATQLGHAPTFYSILSTRSLAEILPDLTDSLWNISADKRILPSLRGHDAREALLRIRRKNGLIQYHEGAVDLAQDTLFKSAVTLPANLVEGSYQTRIFLLRQGQVVDSFSTDINVQKVGIERWLHRLAYSNSLLYGLLALAIAGFFGWAASEAFRLIRR